MPFLKALIRAVGGALLGLLSSITLLYSLLFLMRLFPSLVPVVDYLYQAVLGGMVLGLLYHWWRTRFDG